VDVTNWSIYINTWEREEQTTDEPILASPKLKLFSSRKIFSNARCAGGPDEIHDLPPVNTLEECAQETHDTITCGKYFYVELTPVLECACVTEGNKCHKEADNPGTDIYMIHYPGESIHPHLSLENPSTLKQEKRTKFLASDLAFFISIFLTCCMAGFGSMLCLRRQSHSSFEDLLMDLNLEHPA